MPRGAPVNRDFDARHMTTTGVIRGPGDRDRLFAGTPLPLGGDVIDALGARVSVDGAAVARPAWVVSG